MTDETKLKKSISAKASGVGKWMKGRKLSAETKAKISKYQQENPNSGRFVKGMVMSEEVKEKIRIAQKGKMPKFIPDNLGVRRDQSFKDKRREYMLGNKCAWIEDRSKLKKRDERNDVAYQEWRKSVWSRDGFICRLRDVNCGGRIEAHHILSWRNFPELRYEINNGITLCHAHHPKKRAEEEAFVPIFQELVQKTEALV